MTIVPRPAPPFAADSHKGRAGRVLIAAGSRAMPGAAILCARAAQRAGAGLVEVLCLDDALRQLVPAAAPEAILALEPPSEVFGRGTADAWVCGPGLGAQRAHGLLAEWVESGAERARPTVLDADALNAFAGRPEAFANFGAALVLTPHPGEAQRLLGRPIPVDEGGRIEAARELGQRARAICCLKGAGTVVVDGRDGLAERVFVNRSGNPGLATAGAGDVLSGVLGAYLAYAHQRAQRDAHGPRPWAEFEAAVAAVHVHGLCADLAVLELGERGLIASDLIAWLPRAQVQFGAATERS